MAVIGYILINAQAGSEHHIQDALSKIPQLSERYALHEQYDFLVRLNALDSSELNHFVDDKIKPISGVIGIKTVLGISSSPVEYALNQ